MGSPLSEPNIFDVVRMALVHDWLVVYGGAERVLEQMLEVFPRADLHAVLDLLSEDQRSFIGGRVARSSFLGRVPMAKRWYRNLLPLMPLAVEQFDLSQYDVVLSSSYAVAKAVITAPGQLHVSYVHSPMRYAWDLQHQYLQEAGLTTGVRGAMARVLLHQLRRWDASTSHRVDVYLANSYFVARRIWKLYRRRAQVIPPPVDTDYYTLSQASRENFYLTASRMVPYKRIDLIVRAFSRLPARRLVVVGDGPEMAKIRAVAGKNVELLGHVEHSTLRDLMQRCKAFIFAALEDFGIVPVEAQACGTPVLAYGVGGARETVVEGETGLFFGLQTEEAIQDAVLRYEAAQDIFDPRTIRNHAEHFNPKRFRHQLQETIERALEEHQESLHHRSLPNDSFFNVIPH